jgi:hypothetical protein
MSELTGKKLNERWRIGAQHALYSKRGNWYHRLERFPGALCDPTGYILFDSQKALESCPGIVISAGDENCISISHRISSLNGYVRRDD